MQVVLFKSESGNWLDKAVKFLTNTDYRHSAIVLDEVADVLHESSGFAGGVSLKRRLSFRSNSTVRIFDLGQLKDKELLEILNVSFRHIEKIDYDFLGFFLWNIGRQDPKKMYCFEHTLFLLSKLKGSRFAKLIDYINSINGSVSGGDIEKVLTVAGFKYKDYKIKGGKLIELIPEKVV